MKRNTPAWKLMKEDIDRKEERPSPCLFSQEEMDRLTIPTVIPPRRERRRSRQHVETRMKRII
jgi:hypothetical protein